MKLFKLYRIALIAVGALTLAWLAHSVAVPASAATQSHPTTTKEMFDQWMTEYSNWGRWGKDDQMGTVNLITPAKRKQAVGLVKEGVSFSLERSVEKEQAIDNPSPFVMKMGVGKDGTVHGVDQISVSYHGYIHTHIVPVQPEQERGRFPLVGKFRPSGGDFQGMRVYRSDVFLGRARRVIFRARQHRLDEPTGLSLGVVASLQSPLPFHPAKLL